MWIVLVDTECDAPDVIGPFSDWEEADKVMLDANYLYTDAWIQKMFPNLEELRKAEKDWEC